MAEYDVVVVGAGAAGCVVARRLADAGRRVCLVEAGPDLRTEVPAEFRDGWSFPRGRHEWGFTAVADDRGQTPPLRRGKLVGGTSWVTRFAVRGNPADFDAWARLGCAGWAFDEVLPWFRRVETDQDFPDAPWHGSDGPMPVTRYPDVEDSEFVAAALRAGAAVGIEAVDDHNRPGAVGIARMPMTSHDGRRVTTADAYLPVDATPQTVTLLADTLVDAVVIRDGAAVGVRLADQRVIRASDVVISAGVYGSPALLMRSGIGPADHLRAVGVQVVVDLPGVGANLADHPTVSIDLVYRGTVPPRPPLHTLATFRSSRCLPTDSPDLALWIPDPGGDPAEAEIDVILMTPASRGQVRLASADPAAAPLIALPQLDAGGDPERLAEGVMLAKELAENAAMRAVCEDKPGTLPSQPLRQRVRQERASTPHTVGTCAMGSTPDTGSVVDPRARVHGVQGLTVVDASIIPIPPSGFPHIVTIMAAERIAEELVREAT